MLRRISFFILVLFFLSGCAVRIEKPAPRPAPPVPAPPPRTTVPPEIPKPPVLPPVIPKPAPPLVRVPALQLPPFTDDMDLESLETAVEKSLQYYKRAGGKGPVRMDDTWVSVKDLQDSLITLREILRSGETAETKQTRIRETFDVYQSTGSDGGNTVLFTGYFESIMKGSRKRTERFKYPVYRAPADAITVNLGRFGEKYKNEQLVGRVKNGELIPYYTRGEIEEHGSLAGRDLELAWVDDRVDLFFLHTQGSGKIELTDGKLLQIGYALKNGRPFQSVSPYLLKMGKITPRENSYKEIKKYLKEHPEELSEILGHNESFIFFRIVKEGPVGAIEEILTPGRSIATDPDVFPKGALAFMRARKPILDKEGNVESWIPFSRFVVSQDVGGLIKGAGRVDLFCGSGGEAEMLAGSLKEKGELYFLVKKRPDGRQPATAVRP
ncbi:MAG: MltA domain-containing protein [Thermodesulfobacteriota bacterium]